MFSEIFTARPLRAVCRTLLMPFRQGQSSLPTPVVFPSSGFFFSAESPLTLKATACRLVMKRVKSGLWG